MTENTMHFATICGDFSATTKFIPYKIALGDFGSPGRNERGENMISYLLE